MPNTTNQLTPRETTKFTDLQAALTWMYEEQVARTTANYAAQGYRVVSCGWRSTKNERVHEIRVLVTVPKEHGWFQRQENAQGLVRLTYPGVREPRCYKTDDQSTEHVVVSFFAFDETPQEFR